jgi:hypothetical protein
MSEVVDADKNRSSVANATESPLLRLPPEIRNMIFKFASQPDWSGWIGCYFNRRGCISRSGTSTRAYKSETRAFAIHLPQVCRQIYSETATLIYSENCFAFQSERAMTKWLSKRLLAQREAIRYMMLPYFVYSRIGRAGEGWAAKRGRDMVMTRAKLLCPNLVEMEEDDWLDECLTCTPAFDVQDWRSRERYPSSGDEGSQYGFSDSGW